MPNPTADWERLGDKFYRKVQLYSDVFDADLELENYFVAGAPYGGAIAIYRDESKVYSYRNTQGAKASIDLYSYSGKLIRRINWDKGPIKGLGWSEDEQLLVVTEDGTARCYHDLQGDFFPFTLGHGAEEHGVVACRFWSTGFVALLGNNTLISVNRYSEPRPQKLATPIEGQVASWTLIPPENTLSKTVEVLLAINNTIYLVDASEAEDRMLQRGPFHHISVSPSGGFVALYTEDGKVWVVSSDFQNRFSEHDTKSRVMPRDMQWCGDDAVVLAWEDEVHLIGPNGASSEFYYDSWVHLIPEIDGVRLLTNDVCEFWQKVPATTQETFKLGSTSPAAILLDAMDHLERKSPKADDNIQLIRPNLHEAVDTCVKAAGQEFSIHWQKQLLKAASFGKSVLDLYNSDEFVDMCETLRVLNAARFYEVGLPLSLNQYSKLGAENLIQRLINRHEYLLALRISDYLQLPTDKVYVHWASQKVRLSADDEESICRLIVEKLSGKKGVSFEEIAQAAHDEGRSALATELLNYELRAGKQVPLLLSMKEDSVALDKAIESGDTDLVFFVLLHLKRKLPLASFFRTINSRPVATALVESSALEDDTEMLKDLYYQDDRPLDSANIFLMNALDAHDVSAKLSKLSEASRLLKDSKEFTFQAKATDEAQKLLKTQESLDKERDSAGGYVGLSVNETMFKLILNANTKKATKIQSDFKVPDKTFWWIRLRALVTARNWNELEEMSKIKKSPIGWEPFFNEILSAGNTRSAAAFIPKCTSLEVSERIDMWIKCGQPVKAGEEALKAKDMGALEELKKKVSGNAVHDIESMIRQLKGGRR